MRLNYRLLRWTIPALFSVCLGFVLGCTGGDSDDDDDRASRIRATGSWAGVISTEDEIPQDVESRLLFTMELLQEETWQDREVVSGSGAAEIESFSGHGIILTRQDEEVVEGEIRGYQDLPDSIVLDLFETGKEESLATFYGTLTENTMSGHWAGGGITGVWSAERRQNNSM